jgi:hypothetical protein
VAGRRSKGDQVRSVHGVGMSLTVTGRRRLRVAPHVASLDKTRATCRHGLVARLRTARYCSIEH